MKSLSRENTEFLEVVAARNFPESAAHESACQARLFGIIDEALQDRDPSVRRQFGTFLAVLRWAPLVRYGGPLEKLNADRQDTVLRWFEDCPIGLLRKGFWGLKAMVFMGYYGQPETNELVGYAPDADGKARLHA